MKHFQEGNKKELSKKEKKKRTHGQGQPCGNGRWEHRSDWRWKAA